MSVTIKRSGKTNQFIVELRDGLDSIRCAVHIERIAEKTDDEAAAEATQRAQALAAIFSSQFEASDT